MTTRQTPTPFTLRAAAATVAVAGATLAGGAWAASAPSTMPAATSGTSDRSAGQLSESHRAELEKALHGKTSKSAVDSALDASGYRVTAVNEADREAIEYEVVKGKESFEVQMHFAGNGDRLDKVEVAPNLWRADTTEAAMEGKDVKPGDGQASSDRRFLPDWRAEKERLAKSLGVGLTADQVFGRLKSLGYDVTAVNDHERDYVEFEVVKGTHSYEVQVDLDKDTGMAKKLDVAANVWKADATEAALERNGG